LTEADLETIADDVPVLDRLAELGCFIGVDGFGAVGSSLSVLRDLPIEIVKIDRRFVAGLGVSTADAAIVESVIDLAARLEIYAIAQGVERAEQATVLAKLGCPAAQGHLFARACDATTIAAAMRGFMRWAGAPPSGGARRRSTSRVTDLLG
jgi:EAL domain-containing protein (putative c-di-GMP-specific phosphodiesterase class I)